MKKFVFLSIVTMALLTFFVPPGQNEGYANQATELVYDVDQPADYVMVVNYDIVLDEPGESLEIQTISIGDPVAIQLVTYEPDPDPYWDNDYGAVRNLIWDANKYVISDSQDYHYKQDFETNHTVNRTKLLENIWVCSQGYSVGMGDNRSLA